MNAFLNHPAVVLSGSVTFKQEPVAGSIPLLSMMLVSTALTYSRVVTSLWPLLLNLIAVFEFMVGHNKHLINTCNRQANLKYLNRFSTRVSTK